MHVSYRYVGGLQAASIFENGNQLVFLSTLHFQVYSLLRATTVHRHNIIYVDQRHARHRITMFHASFIIQRIHCGRGGREIDTSRSFILHEDDKKRRRYQPCFGFGNIRHRSKS